MARAVQSGAVVYVDLADAGPQSARERWEEAVVVAQQRDITKNLDAVGL